MTLSPEARANADRIKREYKKNHPEYYAAYNKRYYAENSDKLKTYAKSYYAENREIMKKICLENYHKWAETATPEMKEAIYRKRRELPKCQCECGSKYNPINRKVHLATKKHQKYIANILQAPTESPEFGNEPIEITTEILNDLII